MKKLSLIIMSGCICSMLLFLILVTSNPYVAEARCPNGYHMGPSGECEKFSRIGDLPRCPNGYHRSPSGNCERVSSGETDSTNSGPEEDGQKESISETKSNERLSFPSSGISLTQSSECRGEADCFKGTVTEIVDGDTIDVNNVRIRLSMVDTPERGEAGYNEATELTESVCPAGAKALVDEDDGQKEGSYDRLIGIVYCNGSTTSVNQILLEMGKAIVYEDFCNVSEFARDKWVTNFGC
jgi:endonuclease YncB( thermonuclease family)